MYMHLLLQFIYTKRIQLINKYKTEELLIGNLNLSVSQRTTISTKNNFIIYYLFKIIIIKKKNYGIYYSSTTSRICLIKDLFKQLITDDVVCMYSSTNIRGLLLDCFYENSNLIKNRKYFFRSIVS